MKKALLILVLYDGLTSRAGVNLKDFMIENEVSLSTFRRYVRDINAYLADTFSGREVVYCKDKNRYYLLPSK